MGARARGHDRLLPAATGATALAGSFPAPHIGTVSPPTPARPRLALRVAVVGHRSDKLPLAAHDAVREALLAVLDVVAREARAALARDAELYREEPPLLTLLTGLAVGADTLGAEAALRRPEWRVHAVLPFALDAYRGDFAEGEERERLHALLARAHATTTLDGTPGSWDAYLPLSRVMVDAADVLVAVWDGEAPAGPGGTANIVRHARRESVPVVRIDPVQGAVPWMEELSAPDHGRERRLSRFDDRLRELLAGPRERGATARWFAERGGPRRTPGTFDAVVRTMTRLTRRGRPAGRRRPGLLARDPAGDRTRKWESDWTELPAPVRSATARHFAAQQGWADELARWYAARFRSTFSLLFLLAVASVTVGAALQLEVAGRGIGLALILPVIEPAVLAAMLYFVIRTRQAGWHERWLDYRSLAEHTRHLAVLWPLGRTANVVRLPANALPHDPRSSWVSWLLRATSREAGLVAARFDHDYARSVRRWLLEHEAMPQRAFHRARRMRLGSLSEPLEALAQRLVEIALILSLLRLFELPTIFGQFAGGDEGKAAEVAVSQRWWVILGAVSTGLPALAAGVHGFLGMADFEGTALRSAGVEGRLAELEQLLEELDPVDVTGVGDLAKEMTRAMEGELGSWHTAAASRRIQPT